MLRGVEEAAAWTAGKIGAIRKPFGKEKLFVHPRLMNLLTRDSNVFEPCRAATTA